MSYQIKLVPGDRQFSVEQGETLLDAATRAGVPMTYGCRGGSCGSCKARLLEGEVDYPYEAPVALSEQERGAHYILACQAVPRSDLVVEAIAPRQQVKVYPVRIEHMEPLAHDVMGLWLKLPGDRRMQFLAGQYIEFLLEGGRARAYSLANPPHADDLLELHIRYYPGGYFSEKVFHELREKAVLRIRGPLGEFTLDEESSRPQILIAGGTGFAPIKGIIEHILAEGLHRPTWLYRGVRARRDLYLHELALEWERSHDWFHYTPVLSEPEAEDAWQGRTGLVHEAVLADFPEPCGYDIYAAGPPVMVQAARESLLARGLPEARFHCDAFEFSEDARAAAGG